MQKSRNMAGTGGTCSPDCKPSGKDGCMNDYKAKIESQPFLWNDKMAQLAIEDFGGIRGSLPYCQCQSIGLALEKLRMIEDGELNEQ